MMSIPIYVEDIQAGEKTKVLVLCQMNKEGKLINTIKT